MKALLIIYMSVSIFSKNKLLFGELGWVGGLENEYRWGGSAWTDLALMPGET